MEKKKLIVTVSGECNSGKSRLSFMLKKFLRGNGFDVDFDGGIDYEDDTFELIELSLEVVESEVVAQPILTFDNLTNIQKVLGLTLSSALLLVVALLVFKKRR